MNTSRFSAIVARDLLSFRRSPAQSLFPLAFFLIACSLFPLGVGAEANTLRQIAPGVIWVSALLSVVSSLNSIYLTDYNDGSLEQMCIGQNLPLDVVCAKTFSHWLLNGCALLLGAPLIGLMFGMRGASIQIMLISLLLGTPVLSMFGNLGAALTLGFRSSHVLQLLLILPLCIPVLIFGSGAITAVDVGVSAKGHLSLLAAVLLFSLVTTPFASAAALRYSQ
jgi:heme exporter protein B